MNLIQWNIGYGADIEKIVPMIKEHIGTSYVVALEEVVPAVYEKLKSHFPNIRYSWTIASPANLIPVQEN